VPGVTKGSVAASAVPEWRRVAALADIEDRKPFPVTIDDVALALYRVNGVVHAVSDICSHEYVRLSGGVLAGAVIECPLHRSRFDVATGRCLARPAEHDLATYDVRVDGDAVFVRVEAAC
jgi:nitrite reductase/ring-hydroxylating ferredoxin subunit